MNITPFYITLYPNKLIPSAPALPQNSSQLKFFFWSLGCPATRTISNLRIPMYHGQQKNSGGGIGVVGRA